MGALPQRGWSEISFENSSGDGAKEILRIQEKVMARQAVSN